jgi:hypothetical protein
VSTEIVSGGSSTQLNTPSTPAAIKKRILEDSNSLPQTPSVKRHKSNAKSDVPKSPTSPLSRKGTAQKMKDKPFVKLSPTAGTKPGGVLVLSCLPNKLTVADPISGSYPNLAEHNPVIIAHSDKYQELFNNKNVCVGVQMEIARLVSSEKIKEWAKISIRDVVDRLCGDNRTSAPLVEEIFCPREMTTYKARFGEEISARVCVPSADVRELKAL